VAVQPQSRGGILAEQHTVQRDDLLNLSSNFKQTTELPFQAIKETGAVEIPRRLKSGADVLQGEIHGEALLLPAQQLSGNADPVEHHLYPEKNGNDQLSKTRTCSWQQSVTTDGPHLAPEAETVLSPRSPDASDHRLGLGIP
jgi:hypothetical protein